MSWGGAPPWVYKEQIARAESDAWQQRLEAEKAKKLTTEQVDENLKCQQKLRDLKIEINRYKTVGSTKIPKKELLEILDKISEILSK